MSEIFIYIDHKNGLVDDSAKELLMAAKKINSDAVIKAIVLGNGEDLDIVCSNISSYYEEIWKFDNEIFSHPNAEVIREVITKILPNKSILLISHSTFAMDLAPGLSIKVGSSYLADVIDVIEVIDNCITVVRQEFGGMVNANFEVNISKGLIITIRPGSFNCENEITCEGSILDKSNEIGEVFTKRDFIEIVESEVGDVDITKSDVLVSVGRGIEDEDNIEIAEKLAEVLGAVVSCSRPIVDAKWMEKSRQVGTSGQTVKPKVYIACGISGSFQHVGGIKGAPFIIAINKNRKAPIFQIADVGVEADILEFIPELTEALKNL